MSSEIATEIVNEATSGGVAGTLGINLKIFIAQLINFGIVLLVLWRWVWKPIMNILDERSKKIEKSLTDAKHIEEEVKTLESKKTEILKSAEAQAQKIIQEANELAEVNRDAVAKKTKVEVERLVMQGKEQLQAEKLKMITDAKDEITDLAIQISEKILVEKISDKEQDTLLKKVLNTL